jgi:hypothetical protein
MAKLIKVETEYIYYAVELTDEQLERYNSGEDDVMDEMIEEVYDDFEIVRHKDGGTDYWIEEE